MYPSNRFESTLVTETGIPIKGVVQPVQDAKIYPDDYFYHRQILRVRASMPIQAGTVVVDSIGRRYLLGSLDAGLYGDLHQYTSFQMYQCTNQSVWERESTEVDPLTNLEKSTGLAPMGTIWTLTETLTRDMSSTNIKTREETKRVLTGAAVELNDVLDTMTVTKINVTHGLRVLEVV